MLFCVIQEVYLPTPDISHLTLADYDHVYEPAEDSFLLMDALQKEKRFLTTCVKPVICLEVGSGSGVISTFLAQMLGPRRLYFTTDINPKAAMITLRTGVQNNVCLNPILTDLSSALQPRLDQMVDVLIFNPPYVVTPSEEVGSSSIEASWAGGERGREVTDRFFPLVNKLLSERGVFYLVIIKENNEEEIKRIMKKYGLKMSLVMSRRSGPEFLSILKFVRNL